MAITENTELNKQEFESRSTDFSINGITAKQSFRVPWANRFVDGPQIGDVFPEEEGVPLRLWCSRVKHVAVGKDDAGTEIARVDVEYSSDQAGIWDISQELDFSIKQENITTGRTWSSDSSTNTQSDVTDVPVCTFQYSFTRPFMNTGIIMAAVNTVNQNLFMWGNPGTWRFLGGRISQSRGGLIPYQGGFVQEATYFQHVLQFEFNRFGHNNYWRTDTGAWDAFTNPPYDSFDHNMLLL